MRCDGEALAARLRCRHRLAVVDAHGEQLVAVRIAHVDAAAEELLLAFHAEVECKQLRELKRLLRLGELASAEIIFRTGLTHAVEKVLLHRTPWPAAVCTLPDVEFTGPDLRW